MPDKSKYSESYRRATPSIKTMDNNSSPCAPLTRSLDEANVVDGAKSACALRGEIVDKDGAAKDVVAKDGIAKDGAAKDVVTKDGIAKDGIAKDGAAKDGAAKLYRDCTD